MLGEGAVEELTDGASSRARHRHGEPLRSGRPPTAAVATSCNSRTLVCRSQMIQMMQR